MGFTAPLIFPGTARRCRGNPFYYFAYGAAVSEVTLDPLTGEWRLDRVDILHDAGASLNPAIDIGQIEGGLYPSHHGLAPPPSNLSGIKMAV